MKKKIIIPLLSLGMILGVCSCSNSSSSSSLSSNDIQEVNKAIVVNEVTRNYLQVGETYKLEAHVYGTVNDSVKYTTSNKSIATVSSDGLVTGIGAGNVNIIAIADDDTTIRKVIKFTIVEDATNLVPGLEKVISQMEDLDFESGVNFNGKINLNLGDVNLKLGESIQGKAVLNTTLDSSNLELPLSIEVRQDESDTEEKVGPYVKANLPLGSLIEDIINSNKDLKSYSSSLSIKGTLVSALTSLVDETYSSYISVNDNNDFESLDIYNYGEETFYTALNRNFGTEEEANYAPYAFSSQSGYSFLAKVLRLVLGLNTNSDFGSTLDTIKESLEIDNITDLFSKDMLLKIQTLLKDYLVSSESENGTKVTLNDTIMSLINTSMSEKNIGGSSSIDLSNGVVINIELPKQIKEIALNLVKNDDTYTSMSLSIKGLKEDGSECEVISLTLDLPSTTIGKDIINESVSQSEKYIKASEDFVVNNTLGMVLNTTSVKEINAKANEFYSMVNDYKVDLSTNTKVSTEISSFLDYYFDSHFASKERQNLLYPMYSKLETIGCAKDVVTIQYPHEAFFDNDYISVNHYVNYLPVDDFTYTFKSSKENIASVSSDGTLKGGAYYSGNVGANNDKKFNNSTSVKVTVTPKEESTLTKAQSLSCTLYYGGKIGFEETKTTYKENEKFNVETHTLTLEDNEEFDLNDILSFPEGYVISTVSLNNTKGILDKNTTTKDNLIVKAITKVIDDDGVTYRYIACVNITVKYPDSEGKTVSEKVVIFVEIK